MTVVKVGLAQINTRVGDLGANAAKVLEAARWAQGQGVDLLVTPELTLTGYPAEDLFLRGEFIRRHDKVFAQLCAHLHELGNELHVVVGHVKRIDNKLYNVASVVAEGRVLVSYCKHELPDYGVFDEERYFSAGREPAVFDVKGVRFGLNVCEDAWFKSAPTMAAEHGAQVLLVLNASPYSTDKQQLRLEQMGANVHGMTTVYVNKVGGQDELVFDGASFVLDPAGKVALRLPTFQEAWSVLEIDASGKPLQGGFFNTPRAGDAWQPALQHWPPTLAQVYEALKLALSDYMQKTGFKQIVLGLSGGMDSALVLAVAVDAVGAQNVRTVMMPSRYTADISQVDAREMARNLGVVYDEILIGALADSFDAALAPLFAGLPVDATEENIQARIRGTLLMALSNKFGSLVVTTGNKSELATGYCTLYGDMAGGFALLKDVPKTMVYALARWRNERSPVIPQRIITRPPSAELRPDQTDQDSLPPYDVLDDIIERYVEQNQSMQEIVQAGHAQETVAQVLRLIRINEYKRRQGAVGPKITSRAFGRDWRMPIANGFRD
ncbi:MAG TPA: NAD+ synthase [Pusillimonas sp.]|uniref:NAD+ synthase n=1 Tax=Pusillimonas sp. TaxID=3040095 RepID=UPI002C893E49|nr:NAD+ synthase [Pusillimonas sp.]HUH86775.1 NAD+ synthase [Pusillimonas sp.]